MKAKIALFVVVMLTLTACGQNKQNAADIFPAQNQPDVQVTGPNSFLTFPNPLNNASGVSEINTLEYTQAYYKAIDPNNDKDTFAKWKAANQFDSGTGTQISVVFGDTRDLGYGRAITARMNAGGTIAFSVENYLVPAVAGYGYATLNLDAAVNKDKRWYIGASNIEFSPGPNGTIGFAKFYFFNPDGSRASMIDMDGRGEKAMPGPCITCHGGLAYPLTPANATGEKLFPMVHNTASLARGDIQGQMHPLELDDVDFSNQAGYTRADQEAAFKTLNSWILKSYPLPVGTKDTAGTVIPSGTVIQTGVSETGFSEDIGRRVASANEWQGTAAAVIKNGYGGNGLPNATFAEVTPDAWASVGQTSLYQNVVVPACRACHMLRGSGLAHGADIDLASYAGFNSYADQTKSHVFDRGNMPLAKILYEKFWSTPSIYITTADYLTAAGYTVRDATKAILKPGHPVADAGPSRTVTQGSTVISGITSMFASNYQWSIASGPANGATLSNQNTSSATFTATLDGTYVVQLVVDNGAVTSDPSQLTLKVNSLLTPAPSTIRFAQIKPVLQGSCVVACHTATNLATTAISPLVYNNIDRNGDSTVDATDDHWLYTAIRGRINFTDPADSPLLLKPAGKHHGGNDPASPTEKFETGFDISLAPGAAGRANYDLFLNWILNGAPE